MHLWQIRHSSIDTIHQHHLYMVICDGLYIHLNLFIGDCSLIDSANRKEIYDTCGTHSPSSTLALECQTQNDKILHGKFMFEFQFCEVV